MRGKRVLCLMGFMAAFTAIFLAACVTTRSELAFPTAPGQSTHGSLFLVPDGEGPFPAVVLLHTCGGVGRHLYEWATRLTGAGYVAFIVDSNTPRRVRYNCEGAPALISLDQIAADAAAALDHLRGFSFVKPDSFGVIGFSWGGMAAIRLAGKSFQQRLAPGAARPAAIAAFYPGCGSQSTHPLVQAFYDWDDQFATRTMLFVGGADDEAPAEFCTAKVDRLRTRGQPISFKLYSNAAHQFDSAEWGTLGTRVTHGVRGTFLYRYDPDATEDAWREVQALFARSLAGGT